MTELSQPLHPFNSAHFGKVDDFLRTAECNDRDTLMIACSDHGTAPDNVSFAGADRFLVLQHLMSTVPSPADGELEQTFPDLIYALTHYDIKHIVLCGHLGCRIIPGWLKETGTPCVGEFQDRFQAEVFEPVAKACPDLKGAALIERLICEHALVQLANLQSHAFISERLNAGVLKLHLWIVNDETARVLSFEPTRQLLLPIEDIR